MMESVVMASSRSHDVVIRHCGESDNGIENAGTRGAFNEF